MIKFFYPLVIITFSPAAQGKWDQDCYCHNALKLNCLPVETKDADKLIDANYC